MVRAVQRGNAAEARRLDAEMKPLWESGSSPVYVSFTRLFAAQS
jgi:hypothetical protein